MIKPRYGDTEFFSTQPIRSFNCVTKCGLTTNFNMSEKKMRSCPFCGSEDIKMNEAVVSMRLGKFTFSCQCAICFASGPVTPVGEAEAINLWNERRKNKFMDNNTPDLFCKEVVNA